MWSQRPGQEPKQERLWQSQKEQSARLPESHQLATLIKGNLGTGASAESNYIRPAWWSKVAVGYVFSNDIGAPLRGAGKNALLINPIVKHVGGRMGIPITLPDCRKL